VVGKPQIAFEPNQINFLPYHSFIFGKIGEMSFEDKEVIGKRKDRHNNH
jgi:hypothetical protein